ncbi:MAG: hypothetical protein N2595_04195 [bacterium]|nr:hypothetical protein [bacterium]
MDWRSLQYFFVTLSMIFFTACAWATNWHCYYTNCLYLYAAEVENGRTVTAVRAEIQVLRRAERFGALTNVVAGAAVSVPLVREGRGFAVYHIFAAQQHRLWEPVELGIRVTKHYTYADGGRGATVREFYWTGRGSGVVRCGGDDTAERVSDREAAAGRALEACMREHRRSGGGTNDVLFVARWGYVS